jgi:transcriptional regulator with XRE-family HTH domain
MARTKIDVKGLHGALDAQRRAQSLSWRQFAKNIGVSPSLLARLGNGYRPDVDGFATLIRWLNMPAEQFMIDEDDQADRPEPELSAQLAPLLRARKDLSGADVTYLEDVIRATVRRAKADRG